MIFNTAAYFVLFLIPAAVLFRLVTPKLQPWVCAVFGASFFVFFSLTQIGGVAGGFCLLIFIWESIFSRFYRQGSVICIIGIVQTLLFLIVFKYWNFFTGLIFASAHQNPVHWSGAFLPLGISFFTFEFIHYAVDRYRGRTPAGTFGEYLAFILFFPTMVAGPIKRYQDFRPKLIQPSRHWQTDWQRGITRILSGLVKKFMVADLLTAMTNHLNHADIARAQRWVLPIWLLGYGMKIYFDFSAYSDIAIGSARLFGIKVPENFDWPYIRTNIAEFWKHWHISLYRWLVDYVFIPLGGSRVAAPRVYLNILITMFLSGLWHGAGLNFVVWGLWHGMLLVTHRCWMSWRSASTVRESGLVASGAPILSGLGLQLQPVPLMATEVVVHEHTPVFRRAKGALASLSAAVLCRFGFTHFDTMSSENEKRQGTAALHDAGAQLETQRETNQRFVPKLVSWALTFTAVNVGWAFFCMDLPTSLFFFRRLIFG